VLSYFVSLNKAYVIEVLFNFYLKVHFTLHWFRKIQNYSKHSAHNKSTETSALENSNRWIQLHGYLCLLKTYL